ncbi:AAA family ATPase [Candidatus Poribacteria bacterium]|nr:AAA family ATPase [Candidatus Poribacteria bacterium]
MSKETIEGITKIAVSGFKSIAEECAIDIRPLTILAGANSSGKSSIMQPLLMLKQTLEAPYDPGPLLLDGPNAQFTLAEQFLSKLVSEERADHFQIRIDITSMAEDFSTAVTFRKGQSGIELVEMTKKASKYHEDMTLYPKMPPEELESLVNRNLMPAGFDAVKRSRCFVRFETQDGHMSQSIIYKLETHIFNSIHLPGLRGNLERTYKPASTGPQYPGTFENYAASIIHEWQETRDERLGMLSDSLYALGLTGQVGTKKIGDTRIELQVGRLPLPPASGGEGGGTDMVSIADVGFGVSQVLPVLVALMVAEPGQLVYLEQPELHLHPRAQVALAQVLAAAAKRGVRVVAETHSSLLLLAIQTLVAEGSLSPELVKLHWFTRGENGATKIDTADLDEVGAYGDWPEDFDDVDLKAQSRYLNAVDRIAFGKTEAS